MANRMTLTVTHKESGIIVCKLQPLNSLGTPEWNQMVAALKAGGFGVDHWTDFGNDNEQHIREL